MNRALLGVVAFVCGVVVLGCGGDDDPTRESPVESDASQDGGGPERPDAARGGDRDAANGGEKDASRGDGAIETGTSCGDLSCKQPATCREVDGQASCVCPEGYDDPKGDGSQCDDKDECADDADNDCDARARCENTAGGYACKCEGPAYRGDGKSCECNEGYTLTEGLCLADDGRACEDDLDCSNGHCEGGTCCAQACNTPGEACLTAEGATCQDGRSCVYPVAANDSACDDGDACTTGSVCQSGNCIRGTGQVSCDDGNGCTDDSCDTTLGCKNQNNTSACDDGNPCTSNDSCAGGTCSNGTLRDCSASADACNGGECNPADGSCRKKPVADGTLCNDANSCNLMDQCSAGACVGQGNACGPNATMCTAGTPNTCACAAGYLAAAGRCVPEMDECALTPAPCSPNADCIDPSNAPNDATCTCRVGFTGNGRECIATEPCAGNPCGDGRGTCTAAAAGQYTCSCAAGYVAVGNTCVCDMSGLFAARTRLVQTWSNLANLEDGTQNVDSWGLERHTYDAQGNLQIEMTSCGGQSADICGTGAPLVQPEAYGQYLPIDIWNKPSIPITRVQLSLPNALPNQPFKTPLIAALLGMTLTDPLGPWPASRQNVQGGTVTSPTVVNGARWVDADDDGFLGVTSFAVPPGGAQVDGVAPDPLTSYGATSPVCPRSNPSAPRLSYNYPPAPENLSLQRIKRVYVASRVLSSFDGQIDSCDRLSGSLIGPDNGPVQLDARIAGCVRVSGGSEAACGNGVLDFLDNDEAQDQRVESGSFVIRRVPQGTTCEQVRALSFD